MSRKKRKKFTPEEKFRIVKEGVTKARSVSEISEEYGIHPNQFYKWQKDFFDGALESFHTGSQGRSKAAESREADFSDYNKSSCIFYYQIYPQQV